MRLLLAEDMFNPQDIHRRLGLIQPGLPAQVFLTLAIFFLGHLSRSSWKSDWYIRRYPIRLFIYGQNILLKHQGGSIRRLSSAGLRFAYAGFKPTASHTYFKYKRLLFGYRRIYFELSQHVYSYIYIHTHICLPQGLNPICTN